MVTTATLQLFKDCKYDIYRNMSNFSDLNAQNTYYNGLTKLNKTITFNKIGDPFILNEDIATLSEYTYGRVQYAGTWWYFQILDLAVNAQGRTVVTYQLDAWETHRYQGNLVLGAGQVTRRGSYSVAVGDPFADFEIMPPMEPNEYYIVDETDRSATGHGSGGDYAPCVFAFVRDNTSDWCKIVCCQLEDLGKTQRNAFLVNTSAIIKYINDVLPDIGENLEIVGAWYSSYSPNMDGTKWVNTEKNGCWYADVLNSNEDMTYTLTARIWYDREIPSVEPIIFNSFNNGEITRFFVADERGNPVFVFADNVIYGSSINMILNITMSSCQWLCSIAQYERGSDDLLDWVGTQTFTIPCEPLDFYNDSWYQYQATQRQMDIDMRGLENQNNVASAGANLGTSAISGAMTGAMVGAVGGPIGAGVGALAGVVASVAGTAITSLYNTSYAFPKEQEIIDTSYKKTGDSLNLNGNGVNGSLMMWLAWDDPSNTKEYWQAFGAGFKSKKSDKKFNDIVKNEMNTYGRWWNISTDDVDSAIIGGAFLANCEVMGIPANWAGQVQERLANGVMFK